MYKFKVRTLTLDKLGMDLKDSTVSPSVKFPKYTQVEEVFSEIDTSENIFLPDFAVKGYYNDEEIPERRCFYIDPEGYDTLYVTGMIRSSEAEINQELNNKFEIPGARKIYYWEDLTTGYLVQVLQPNRK